MEIRLQEPRYKNWIICSLGLLEVKEALHGYVTEILTSFQETLIKKGKQHDRTFLQKIKEFLSLVNKYTIKRGKKKWTIDTKEPSLEFLFNAILEQTSNPNSQKIYWSNSNLCKVCEDVWEIAKVFMPGGNKKSDGPENADPAAIFNILNTCKLFKHIDHAILDKLMKARNDIAHSCNNMIETDEMNDILTYMIDLLELDNSGNDSRSGIACRKECKKAAKKIKKLKNGEITITLNFESKALQDKTERIDHDIRVAQMDGKETSSLNDLMQKTEDDILSNAIDLEKEKKDALKKKYDEAMTELSKTENDSAPHKSTEVAYFKQQERIRQKKELYVIRGANKEFEKTIETIQTTNDKILQRKNMDIDSHKNESTLTPEPELDPSPARKQIRNHVTQSLIEGYRSFLRQSDFKRNVPDAEELHLTYHSLHKTPAQYTSLADFLYVGAGLAIIDTPLFDMSMVMFCLINDWLISKDEANTTLNPQQMALKKYDLLLVVEGDKVGQLETCSCKTLLIITDNCLWKGISAPHSCVDNLESFFLGDVSCSKIMLNESIQKVFKYKSGHDRQKSRPVFPRFILHKAISKTRLYIQRDSDSQLANLHEFEIQRSVKTVVVLNSTITKKDISTLHNSRIEHVCLHSCMLSLPKMNNLPRMKYLKSLTIQRMSCKNVELIFSITVEKLQMLTCLTLYDTNVSEQSDHPFETIRQLFEKEVPIECIDFHLSLNILTLNIETLKFFEQLSRLKRWKSLNIQNVHLRNNCQLPVWESVTSLSVGNIKTDDDTMKLFIASISVLKNLETVVVNNLSLGKSMSEFPEINNVRSLVLENVKADDATIKCFKSSIARLRKILLRKTGGRERYLEQSDHPLTLNWQLETE